MARRIARISDGCQQLRKKMAKNGRLKDKYAEKYWSDYKVIKKFFFKTVSSLDFLILLFFVKLEYSLSRL